MSDRRWLMIAALLALFLAVGIYYSLLEEPAAFEEERGDEDLFDAEQIFYGAELTVYTGEGAVVWNLRSQVMKRYTDEELVTMRGIEARSREDDEHLLTVVADGGEVDTESGDIVFAGNVSALSHTHDTTLEADELRWYADGERLMARGNVEVLRQGMRVRAPVMTADRYLDDIVIGE